MAKITLAQVAEAHETLAAYYRQQAGGKVDSTTSTDETGDEEAVEVPDEETVRGMGIKDLRELAVALELDEQKVKKDILAEMEAKSLFGDSDNEDEEEEEYDEEEEDEEEDDEDGDEEEDEEDEEEELSREDLEEMSLKELRDLAKSEGFKSTQYRAADKDALVDLLAGDEDDDEDEEDEDEAEEDTEELDEDALMAMSLAEVKKVAADVDVKIPANIAKNKKKIVSHIMENAAEE